MILGIGISSCEQDTSTDHVVNGTENPAKKGPQVLSPKIEKTVLLQNIPELYTYNEQLQASLGSNFPVIPFPQNEMVNADYQRAQQLALNNRDFLRDVVHRDNGAKLHNEVVGIRPFNQSDVKKYKIEVCNACYLVQMYNYYYSTTVTAIVNVAANQVVKVEHSAAMTPMLNNRMKDLAVKIALQDKTLCSQLGVKPGEMPTDYTLSIEPSKCERSRHLCVAPVFVKGNKKLWSIVDMTGWYVLGWQWVENEDPKRPVIVTGRTLQNDYLEEQYCGKTLTMERGDWSFEYEMTSSDGVEMKNLRYKGKKILKTAKIVDWHVSYDFKENFGYNDAMGCPVFSSAAVVAFAGPEINEIVDERGVKGFAFVQDFRSPVWPLACNYRYQNLYEFYDDGSFRIAGVNKGLGCGVTGWYRPVFRMDFVGDGGHEKFASWNGNTWRKWKKEAWNLQDEKTSYTKEGYLYRLSLGVDHGYYVEPSYGQFKDGGRGDNAYTYITKYKAEEGDGDLPTFGDCCNTDHRQGPDDFQVPSEDIENKDLVMWYVPQMANDDTPGKEYCWAATVVKDGKASYVSWQGVIGPKFIPFNQ